MEAPNPIVRARVEAFFGGIVPMFWRRVLGSPTSLGERWFVQLSDGSSRFVKIAGGNRSAAALRNEYRVYSQLEAAFMPRLLGWSDDNRSSPFIVLEDLSQADWPPPWEPGRVDSVLKTLAAVHATRLDLPKVIDQAPDRGGWEQVRKDPLPFLSLGLCSRVWLEAALPKLLAASIEAPLDGDDLIHMDVRSENICFLGPRVVLSDWNWTARGNGDLDLAFWAPGLQSEGGPPPESLLPKAPEWAGLVSGFIAARAGVTPMRDAVRIRETQLKLLKTALPWAVRALELAPLDGRPIPS